MYAKFNSVKNILLIVALCLFITGCTNDGILELQEETFEVSLSSENDELLTSKGKQQLHFNASLKGKNETPPVNSKATGEAIVKISKDKTMVHFKVNVANIMDVTKAHFHKAPFGVKGGVVATIYPTSEPTGRMQGTLAEGYVSSVELAKKGLTMAEFILAIRNGEIYVNVHTVAYGGGEIRGQLK